MKRKRRLDQLMRSSSYDLTRVFCTSGSERKFTLEGRWYGAGADRELAAAIEVGIANGKTTPQACKDSTEEALTRAIVALASEYGRYGYRRITVKVREAGWPVSIDQVQRIRRREGLKVPRNRGREGVYAERWVVRTFAAGAGQPCVELRFRQRQDA